MRREEIDEAADGVPEAVYGSFSGLAQEGLQPGEGILVHAPLAPPPGLRVTLLAHRLYFAAVSDQRHRDPCGVAMRADHRTDVSGKRPADSFARQRRQMVLVYSKLAGKCAEKLFKK